LASLEIGFPRSQAGGASVLASRNVSNRTPFELANNLGQFYKPIL
jgi:hypothetical protein